MKNETMIVDYNNYDLLDVHKMYDPLVNCLDNMCLTGLSVWDRQSLSKAHGCLFRLTSSD